jgi:hypothetical protein
MFFLGFLSSFEKYLKNVENFFPHLKQKVFMISRPPCLGLFDVVLHSLLDQPLLVLIYTC